MQINIEERVARARELFLEGYNCAQAVVMAYSDVMELAPEQAFELMDDDAIIDL